jgi:hypothetical protein
MSKFTPGPWKVMGPAGALTRPGIDAVHSSDGEEERSIIIVGTDENGRGISGIANAKLIASAPDLYEALQKIMSLDESKGGIMQHIASRALSEADKEE